MSASPLPSFAGGEVDEARMQASLKTLEQRVRRRLDGVLKGDHQGLLPGPGSEPGESRPYTPGDDVRQGGLARTGRPPQHDRCRACRAPGTTSGGEHLQG